MMKRTIGHEIKILSNMMKRRVSRSQVIAESNKLTGMHGWVIGYLYHNQEKGDIFQRDLENEFTIRRSTATGILKLMEKNGLILREPVDYDARLKKLVLTPKAIAIHEKVSDEIDTIETELTVGINEEELQLFFQVLEKMKRNLE
jgi:DNA-binding MarR family transcriptional regulator